MSVLNMDALLASPVTLAFSGLILFGHLLTRLLSEELASGLYLEPGNTVTKPWQVLTAGFFDDSLLSVLVTVPMLMYCGTRLRDTWGDREVACFVVLVNVLQTCATWVVMMILYILFRSEHFLFVCLPTPPTIAHHQYPRVSIHMFEITAWNLPP